MSTLQAVIHISSSAVCTVIGQIEHTSTGMRPTIMAVGLAHTDAFAHGQVVHREYLRQALHKSVQEATDMSGTRIYSPIVSWSSPLLSAENDMQTVTVASAEGLIDSSDLHQAQVMVEQSLKNNERTLLQRCQQMVCLDSGEQVQDAIGLRSKRIDIYSHVMSVPENSYQQMVDLLKGNDIEDCTTVFDGVAGAYYALTENEKRQGVCYIDIGATMTKVCVYSQGVLIYTDCLDVGGTMVDMDIAKECSIALADVDSFKRQEGTLNHERYSPGAHIIYKKGTKSEKTMLRRALNEVIEARYYEIFSEIFARLEKANLIHAIDAGVVLAGGATQMDGLIGFIRANFGILARRVSAPTYIELDHSHMSDDTVKFVQKHLQDSTLHSAIGLFLFSGSEQFANDQQIQYEVVEKVDYLKEFSKLAQKFISLCKKVIY